MNEEHTPDNVKSEELSSSETQNTSPMKTPTEVVVEPEEITSTPAGTLAEKKRRLWTFIAIVWAVIVVVIIAIAIVMVYWFPGITSNTVRSWMVNTFPFPTAVVRSGGDMSFVRLSTYENTVAAAKHFFAKQAEYGLSLAAQPTEAVLREQEYDRQVEMAYTEQLADDMGIEVTQEELDTYFTEEIVPQATSEEEIVSTLKDLYNWEIPDFKQHVLYPVVLRKKLTDAITEQSDAAAKAKAETVLAEVKKGEKSFADLAKEYTDDVGSADTGGALGTFGRGVMVEEFEEAVFALEVGQTSDLVKTQYGYHIITVTAKDTTADTVEASHILVMFETVDDKIAELEKDAKVYKLLPHYPEAEKETDSAIENPYTNTNSAAPVEGGDDESAGE